MNTKITRKQKTVRGYKAEFVIADEAKKDFVLMLSFQSCDAELMQKYVIDFDKEALRRILRKVKFLEFNLNWLLMTIS